MTVGARTSAQTPDVRHATDLLYSGLGLIDDVATMTNGDLVIAQPSRGAIEIIDHVGGNVTALTCPPIISAAIDVDSAGMIYACDGVGPSGSIRRIDPQTSAMTTIVGGFIAPFDIVMDGTTAAYVADLTTPNFQTGISDIWRIDWSNGLPAQKTLIATGFLGPADIAIAADGTIYVTSFGETALKAIDPVTHVVTTITLSEPLYGATDCLMTKNGGIVVSMTAYSRIVYVEPGVGNVATITDLIGGSIVGLEDMAFDADGNLVASISTGELHRVDIMSPFRALGPPRLGASFFLVMDHIGPPGDTYVIGCSFTATTGTDVFGQFVPLDLDGLLVLTLTQRPASFVDFDGILDGTGSAIAAVNLDYEPSLVGFAVHFAAASFNPQNVLPLTGITNAIRVELVL